MKPTMAGSLDRREKASTAPGLVVWSSSTVNSNFLPRTPFSLISSTASLIPVTMKPPDSAAGPVTGEVTPIFSVSAARATNGIASAGMASVPAEASIKLRRDSGTAILPDFAGWTRLLQRHTSHRSRRLTSDRLNGESRHDRQQQHDRADHVQHQPPSRQDAAQQAQQRQGRNETRRRLPEHPILRQPVIGQVEREGERRRDQRAAAVQRHIEARTPPQPLAMAGPEQRRRHR